MKRKKIIFVSIAVLFTLSTLVADPAQSVSLELSNDTLTVTALHRVRKVTKHYISDIDIIISDSLISHNEYTEQTDADKMVQQFVLPSDLLIDGTAIYAETVCNKYGTTVGEFTIALVIEEEE